MQVAEVAAMRSTCYRGNVGAVIVKDRDIVSFSYNGPASGEDHCHGNDCQLQDGGCMRSEHAEKNAIVRALKKLKTYTLTGCELYCTYSPCLPCATLIHRNSIMHVYYRYPYRDPAGILFLLNANAYNKVFRITPSGYVVDQRSGIIVSQA